MTTSTAYVRRFRERQREGKLVIRIEVDGPTRDQLVEAGFLGEYRGPPGRGRGRDEAPPQHHGTG
jgi:hypothetical protein